VLLATMGGATRRGAIVAAFFLPDLC